MNLNEFAEAIKELAAGRYCKAGMDIGSYGAKDQWRAYISNVAWVHEDTPEAALETMHREMHPEIGRLEQEVREARDALLAAEQRLSEQSKETP